MPTTRAWMRSGLSILLLCACSAASGADWPDWEQFRRDFVQGDGRVIDVTFEGKSTSEGQAYGLFFALVANQRQEFDTILRWTSDNLAGQGLGERLPGWYWGKKDDGSWGLKDPNPASDADLWIAYTLLEAARLWHAPAYERHGRKLLALIAAQETTEAGAAGTLLLPAPVGFKLGENRWRLVTSYEPPFLLRYFAAADPSGPWAKILASYIPIALHACAKGVAPDIFEVDSSGTVYPDTQATPVGSYDAIRVYMWAAMAGADGAPLLKQLAPYATLVKQLGNPPEKVDPASGRPLPGDYSPLGYSGAMLPYLKVLGENDLLDSQRRRIKLVAMRQKLGVGNKPNYYDQALILFGEGWDEGRYHFDANGRLVTQWAP